MRRRASDLQLLRRARWDAEAFRAFYRRYAEPLTAWLESEAGARDVALEIAAETFAQALVNAGRFRGGAAHGAGPWLYGVAADLLGRHWAGEPIETRSRRRLGVLEETRFRPNVQSPAGEAAQSPRVALRLEAALDGVPVAFRDAVRSRVLDRGEGAAGLGVRRSRWL
jgi:DNA-directed RNA polymerase specialized sigma24 family protein